MSDEQDPVHFNFAQDPGGTVAFNAVFEGGFDKNKAVHRFAMNLMRYLESDPDRLAGMRFRERRIDIEGFNLEDIGALVRG